MLTTWSLLNCYLKVTLYTFIAEVDFVQRQSSRGSNATPLPDLCWEIRLHYNLVLCCKSILHWKMWRSLTMNCKTCTHVSAVKIVLGAEKSISWYGTWTWFRFFFFFFLPFPNRLLITSVLPCSLLVSFSHFTRYFFDNSPSRFLCMLQLATSLLHCSAHHPFLFFPSQVIHPLLSLRWASRLLQTRSFCSHEQEVQRKSRPAA